MGFSREDLYGTAAVTPFWFASPIEDMETELTILDNYINHIIISS